MRQLPRNQTLLLLSPQRSLDLILGQYHLLPVRRLRAENHQAAGDDGEDAEEGDGAASVFYIVSLVFGSSPPLLFFWEGSDG